MQAFPVDVDEAIVVKASLQIAVQMGITGATLATDSANVVTRIQAKEDIYAEIGPIIVEIIQKLDAHKQLLVEFTCQLRM
ncbi:conserved hypothetical protein [Ricinus communis]|uniref:RNase H type-1 domain-containing protein n=1 Tax=Ricinus communis TaxID=3988 RepID=B9SF59_RICCO|nr:conserved hypothetical protein [Ricinus communis]